MPWIAPALLIFFLVVGRLIWAPMGAPGGAERTAQELRPLAQAMLVQHQALMAYAIANQGATGTISSTSLSIPAPYQAAYQVVTEVNATSAGRTAVTYYQSTRYPAGDVVDALVQIEGSIGVPSTPRDTSHVEYVAHQGVGLSSAAGLKSPAGTLTPLPSDVPAGVAAVADLVPAN